MFKNVPVPPATVVGKTPFQLCAFKYSTYKGVISFCFNFIANANACASIITFAESPFAIAIFSLASASATKVLCCAA